MGDFGGALVGVFCGLEIWGKGLSVGGLLFGRWMGMGDGGWGRGMSLGGKRDDGRTPLLLVCGEGEEDGSEEDLSE